VQHVWRAEERAAALQGQIALGSAKTSLEQLRRSGKLTDNQRAFVERNFTSFKSESKDEAGVKF